MKLVILIQLAGLSHLGLLCAGAVMPKVVGLPRHIANLPAFIHRLIWVYYAFLALCLAGFGAVSFLHADVLASGGGLARAVCGFLCVFWTARLFVAAFVFDVRPYLTSAWRKLGYTATNIVFAAFPVIYGWAALKGAAP